MRSLRAASLIIQCSTAGSRSGIYQLQQPFLAICSHRKMSTVPLKSVPAVGQLVSHDGATYSTVREGLAYILIPPDTQLSTEPKAKTAKAGEHPAPNTSGRIV
jgi:hypothetical protein